MRPAAAALALLSLVTVPQQDGQRSNPDGPYVSVSGDGRFVALVSLGRLVSADTNHWRDVYVLDRSSGSVSLESEASDGSPVAEDTDHPALNRDGRFLVYESGDRIMWRDRVNGFTRGIGKGDEPALSGDGRLVAFTSADGLMLFDVATQSLTNVAVDVSGHRLRNVHGGGSLSDDGRYLAFSASAETAGARALANVYVRDLLQGTTRVMSVGLDRKPANGDSWTPAMSADGCCVAFASGASNLVRGDRNRSVDVFLANVATGTVELISRNSKGDAGNGASGRPALSAGAQVVVFQSEASDLVKPGDDINLLWDVFRFERSTRKMTRLTTDPANEWMESSGGPAMDSSGGIVAFSSRHPMNATDTLNDFDLFVLNLQR